MPVVAMLFVAIPTPHLHVSRFFGAASRRGIGNRGSHFTGIFTKAVEIPRVTPMEYRMV